MFNAKIVKLGLAGLVVSLLAACPSTTSPSPSATVSPSPSASASPAA